MFHFLILQYSFAQSPNHQINKSTNSKIDSLLNVLKTTKEDTTKVKTLRKLAFELQYTNPDSTIILATQSAKLAQKINFKKGEASAYGTCGVGYHVKGDYLQALEYYFKALRIAEELENKNLIATWFGNIGIVYREQGEYPQALEYYFKALRIAEELGNKNGTAISLGNIGLAYWNQGDYPQALEYFFKALKIVEELGNKNGIAANFGNIGIVYGEQGDYPQALEYYFKALKIDEELGNKNGVAAMHINIGNVYCDQGGYPQALEYYFKALRIAEALGDKDGIARCLGNIGVVYKEQGDYPQALEYYFKALKMHEELGNKNGIAIWLGNIGSVYIIQNKLKEAEKFLKDALQLAVQIDALNLVKDENQYLSELYSKKGEWKTAMEHYKKYMAARDSIFSEENLKKIVRMETNYKWEKKEAAAKAEQEKKDAIAAEESKRQQMMFWFMTAAAFAAIVVGAIIYRSLRTTRRQKKIIEEQKEIVDKEREKSEKLLLNILPKDTAEELKTTGKAQPKSYEMATVMFTDFKGFTMLAEKMSAEELVTALDFVFKKFDEIISRYPIEKIKTIGDAYMCAGGLPVANATNPMDVVNAALDIKKFMLDYKEKRIAEGKPYFEIRIGVHTGSVVAGVVGDKKFAYDIWGDTVNTASRMESSGVPGHVNISGETYKNLQGFKNLTGLNFAFRGKIPAKNKGEIEMYFVERGLFEPHRYIGT